MFSKKIIITTALVGTSLALVGTLIGTNTFAFTISRAAATDKDFTFNQSVASKVTYSGSPTNPVVSNVTTDVSTPISVKFYRESAPSGAYSPGPGENGSFLYDKFSCEKTYAFEAGINNLTKFEIQFKYIYSSEIYDDFDDHFNYNVQLTFYNGNTVVDTAYYSSDRTTKGVIYTHTWDKSGEVSQKIDYFKCTLYSGGGGGGRDTFRELFLYYYKVWWSC